MAEQKWYRKRIFSRLILILVGVIIGLLLIEGGLRLFESFTGNLNRDLEGRGELMEDDKLGRRVAPDAPGHDANGFRNAEIPDVIDIVCIGDSQTWSNNAAVQHAWPQTLGRLSEQTVYNMGMGGYGPAEYWYLAEEAIAMNPDTIVIGLYMGNDIADAYRSVYRTDRLTEFRDPAASEDVFTDTIMDEAQELTARKEETTSSIQNNILYKWAMNLRNYSATVRQVTDGLRNLLNPTYKTEKTWALNNPEEGTVYESGDIKTILTTAARLLAVDTDTAAIKAGLQATEDILVSIKNKTDAAGINLLVLVIPTKESVYAGAVTADQDRLSTTYMKLLTNEQKVKESIFTLCEENGIEYADALPFLKEAVTEGEHLYPESSDGHPMALGYYRIAAAAEEKLEELGW